MKTKKFNQYVLMPVLAFSMVVGISSCKKDDPEPNMPPSQMMSATYNYEFHNGQVVESAAYNGTHPDNFNASMKVEETGDGTAKVTVTLNNTVSGAMYSIHAHDAADPATTPNGTPYNESPNTTIFSKMVTGNGGTVTVSQDVSNSYNYITSTYNGFLVVHDPLQNISTTDISTYLIVGAFARTQASSGLANMSFDYMFNTGQVAAIYAYDGTHANSLSTRLRLQELADGTTRVSVMLMNSIDGEMYMVHAHDMADPTTTPNGTPYDETPNGGVLSLMINGNGGTAFNSQFSSMTIADLTSVYEGFLVVHDPLQALSTTDPTTYVILGVFASN